MAQRPNYPMDSFYQKRNHIRLAKNQMSRQYLFLFGLGSVEPDPDPEPTGFTTAGGLTVETETRVYHLFSSDDTFVVTGAAGQVNVFLLGGGGAGGGINVDGDAIGGGGGAGGYLHVTDEEVEPGEYSITVGAGGVAPQGATADPGQSGGDTTAFDHTALGGGGGGKQYTGAQVAALVGGCGGGGCGAPGTSTLHVGAAGTEGQGFAGGNGFASGSGIYRRGGGGGGVSAAGSSATAAITGRGGAGLTFASQLPEDFPAEALGLTGAFEAFGGGGGGGYGAGADHGGSDFPGGVGGLGGGGLGGVVGVFAANASSWGAGGGGGGDNIGATGDFGGNGYSGLVIIYREKGAD